MVERLSWLIIDRLQICNAARKEQLLQQMQVVAESCAFWSTNLKFEEISCFIEDA